MKIKSFLSLVGGMALLCPVLLHAQPATSISDGLQALVKKSSAKIRAGDRSETNYTEELQGFDDLVAQAHGAKTDDVAQVLLAKAQLYLFIFKDTVNAKATFAELKENYPDTTTAKRVDGFLASLNQKNPATKIREGLAVGVTFPDFARTNLDGNLISLADYKGKIVLLEFWATDCAPFKAELPNLIATYQKHHPAGFEIISVNLDSKRAALDAYLQQATGLTWPSVFDGRGQPDSLAKKYGVESIPYNYLIDADGKIIGKGLLGEDLEVVVATALAKK